MNQPVNDDLDTPTGAIPDDADLAPVVVDVAEPEGDDDPEAEDVAPADAP